MGLVASEREEHHEEQARRCGVSLPRGPLRG